MKIRIVTNKWPGLAEAMLCLWCAGHTKYKAEGTSLLSQSLLA